MHGTNKCQTRDAYEDEGLEAGEAAGNNNAADVLRRTRHECRTPACSAAHMLEETRLTYMERERGMLGVQEAAGEAVLHIPVYFINSTTANPAPTPTHTALWTLTLSASVDKRSCTPDFLRRSLTSDGGDICSPRRRTVCVTNNPGAAARRSGVSLPGLAAH